jgi:hypothetical protein
MGHVPDRSRRSALARDSQHAIAENFKDVADPARRRILCDNARALYGL